jgi:4-hydroxy-tetrahydrodipicolinate reductase
MKIALIGYGKMGKTIERLGLEQGHSFPLVVDLENPDDLNSEGASRVDVAIEFTLPGSAPDNVKKCIELGIPVVTGTTGWNDRFAEVDSFCREHRGSLFRASNFSIGVNILFALNRKLAGIMKRFPQYSPSVEEVHHVHKLDAPSGTAITLAQGILETHGGFRTWSLEPEKDPAVLHIEAKREGEVKGIHRVTYASEQDRLILGHEALSRDAFAAGALMAASFLQGKKGIFSMDDLLQL